MSNNSYSALAEFYDKFTLQDCDYVSWSQYLSSIAKKHNALNVVDLACGTGKMTALLVDMGYVVTAVDSSAQMLSFATDKCNATFIMQDMRKLKLLRPSDMATCVNDGVNYVKPAELEPFFRTVAQNLKSGAPFVFDVSSPHKLSNILGDNIFYRDDDTETLLWTNTPYDDRIVMDLTLFVKRGETYVRYDERHTQYIHTQENVLSALSNAGFDVVEATSDYGKTLTKKSNRVTYYAVKK